MSLRHIGMYGVVSDEILEQEVGLVVGEVGGAHSHVEVGVGLDILLLVGNVLIHILEVALGARKQPTEVPNVL